MLQQGAKPARSFVAVVAFVAFVAAVPVAAMPPPDARLERTIPASSETYPANATPFFFGAVSLAEVAVFVDGREAAFAPAAGEFNAGLGARTARIEPTPTPGQDVVIVGDFCGDQAPCMAALHYRTGPPDVEAPAPASAVSYDVDESVIWAGRPQDFNVRRIDWTVNVDAVAAALGEAPVLVRVEAVRASAHDDVIVERTQLAPFKPLRLLWPTEVTSSTAAESVACFRVTVRDAAGNAASGPPILLCDPCHSRSFAWTSGTRFVDPGPPTARDRVANGACPTHEATR